MVMPGRFADARTSAPAHSGGPLRERLLQLARVLAAMPQHEADDVLDLALGRAMLSRAQVKRRRREALQAVLALYPRPWTSKTASAVALDLSEYAVAGWMQDRERGGAPLGDARRQALFDFMSTNNGATLGRTQIWELGIRGAEIDSEQ